MTTVSITHQGYTSTFDYPDTFSPELIGTMVQHYLDLYKLLTAPIGDIALDLKNLEEELDPLRVGSKRDVAKVNSILSQAAQETVLGTCFSPAAQNIYKDLAEQVKPKN